MKNIEKIKAKEAKQLAHWKKEAAKKPIQGYLGIMLILCGLIRLVDEFATSVASSMQSSIAAEFYPGLDLAEAVGQYGTMGTLLTLFSIVAVFLVALADKYGRRMLLIISALGMGLGMLLCAWSPNYGLHMVGRAVITLFVSTDFHVLYITESAPDKSRSMFLSVATVLGYAGVMLVSVGRLAFTDASGNLNWRGVYLIPAVAAIILGILMLTLSNEPKVFLQNRIDYLSIPYEERERKAKEEKSKQVGLGYSFKYIFKHKQTRVILWATLIGGAATMAFFGYYEGIMAEAWGSGAEGSAMASQALLIYPIGSAVMALLTGWLGDKIGRKATCLISAVVAVVGLFAFIFGAQHGWNPYLVGFIYGIEMGAYWGYTNTMGIAKNELLPTEIRASAVTAMSVITLPFTLIAGIVIGVVITMTNSISTVCLIWGIVTLGISLLIYAIFGRETKNADLSNVQSD